MRVIVVVVASFVVVCLAACGGSDSATDTPSAAPLTSGAPSGTARTVTATPVGQKSATPVGETPSVAVTAPGQTFTPPPVASIGTPAAAPADQEGFSTSFAGQSVDLQDCSYRLIRGIVDCNSVIYALNPPMTGQDVSCTLWVVGGTPRAMACQAAEPAGTTYYEIQ